MAPEAFEPPLGFPADVWSLACVLVELVTGVRPWHDLQMQQIMMAVAVRRKTPDVPDNIPAAETIRRCFKAVADRPTAAELAVALQEAQDPWPELEPEPEAERPNESRVELEPEPEAMTEQLTAPTPARSNVIGALTAAPTPRQPTDAALMIHPLLDSSGPESEPQPEPEPEAIDLKLCWKAGLSFEDEMIWGYPTGMCKHCGYSTRSHYCNEAERVRAAADVETAFTNGAVFYIRECSIEAFVGGWVKKGVVREGTEDEMYLDGGRGALEDTICVKQSDRGGQATIEPGSKLFSSGGGGWYMVLRETEERYSRHFASNGAGGPVRQGCASPYVLPVVGWRSFGGGGGDTGIPPKLIYPGGFFIRECSKEQFVGHWMNTGLEVKKSIYIHETQQAR